jgi:polysaccharide export outer membrane protein
LGLNVKSLNPEGSAIFNLDNGPSSSGSGGSSSGGSSGGSSGSSGNGQSSGYLVDKNGDIDLPLVHKIKMDGLTLAEAQSKIHDAILPYLKEPTVTVKILNFRITILGDVGAPSTYTVNSEHISVPQALALAGDLTISGKRDNILLIREINGERKFANININSSKFFESPYYYLKNNDILYVEAGKSKFYTTDPFKQTLPIVLSFISLILTAISLSRIYKL